MEWIARAVESGEDVELLGATPKVHVLVHSIQPSLRRICNNMQLSKLDVQIEKSTTLENTAEQMADISTLEGYTKRTIKLITADISDAWSSKA